MTTLTIEPIRDGQFGARVGGITHDALADPSVREDLVVHFERSGLLIFEDVEPTSRMQLAISTVFGPLKDHPSKATPRVGGDDMLGVIELRHDPAAGGVVRIGDRRLAQWLPWHFDHCYNDELNRAGVLRAIEVPPSGGRTGFVDGIALYHAVSPEVRRRIEDKTVIYAMDVFMGNLRYGRPDDFEEVRPAGSAIGVMAEYRDRPRALHPAVWTRESGESVLHVSPWMAKGIVGVTSADADELLTEVCNEIVDAAEDLGYFHEWRRTDMVIWDNWRVLHSVSGMPPEHPRCMHRTTLAGDYGLGRFEAAAPTGS
jgi:alpha-ketoglutarate-dependent taurine dioxygenase